ncbi:MAG TPA: PfkB family carbohydrate kinase [Ktedonobacteraceae bacterium]|nr:PfkB family carbohydrate kinase [Ktedonobacteraceae bacterium]
MSSDLPEKLQDEVCPAFLTIGHVTRDLLPDGDSIPGGTATFAALTASRLGVFAGIVSCADEALRTLLASLLPGVALAIRSTPATTTFENRYSAGFRVQYLRERSTPLEAADIPAAWSGAPVTLLAPLAQEISPALVRNLSLQPGSLLAATPQGWLRRWDTDGRVWPTPWEGAEELLPLLDVLILSHDDLLPFADGQRTAADALLADWSRRVPLLVATDGRHGATLFENGIPRQFPAYTATEVDPTGAGDVFAAAFLIYFSQHHRADEATNFANCVASLSIEYPGIAGIPTPEQIAQRLRPLS